MVVVKNANFEIRWIRAITPALSDLIFYEPNS